MLHSSANSRTAHNRSDASPSDSVREGHVDQRFVLIAERFAQFADGGQVLTVSDVVKLASSASTAGSTGTWEFHLGQGIEPSDLDALMAVGVTGDGPTMRLADSEPPFQPPVSPIVVHKNRPENVLLAGLRAESRFTCSADLRIHQDNELLADHPPGRHVPGMVIIEAMRQICTAHFETSYRPGLPQHDYLGIWQRLDLNFDGFLFPLRATVHFEITEADLSRPTRLQFRATTSIRQNGKVAASAVIDYSMVERERMEVQERRFAKRAAQAQLAGPLSAAERLSAVHFGFPIAPTNTKEE